MIIRITYYNITYILIINLLNLQHLNSYHFMYMFYYYHYSNTKDISINKYIVYFINLRKIVLLILHFKFHYKSKFMYKPY